MKVQFKTNELKHFYVTPLDELKGKLPFQREVIKHYKKKVQLLIAADSIEELGYFKSLNFKKLKGKRKNEYSIRLNKQYRLIFTINKKDEKIIFNVLVVEEISKHNEK
ncbi:MAG TPA: type II toxin-antitoxin system RelE/ParE family toxin [Tangfeifania sp.]|nr:type II toxin-antitoxin system RelE/ParE family toxin [Tangfeifania sp.]